jgi:hypothetical protein
MLACAVFAAIIFAGWLFVHLHTHKEIQAHEIRERERIAYGLSKFATPVERRKFAEPKKPVAALLPFRAGDYPSPVSPAGMQNAYSRALAGQSSSSALQRAANQDLSTMAANRGLSRAILPSDKELMDLYSHEPGCIGTELAALLGLTASAADSHSSVEPE